MMKAYKGLNRIVALEVVEEQKNKKSLLAQI